MHAGLECKVYGFGFRVGCLGLTMNAAALLPMGM